MRLRWPNFSRGRGLVRLRVGPSAVRAEVVRRGRVIWAAQSQLTVPDDLASAIAQIAGEPTLAGRPTRLVAELERPLVQLRTLDGLPPVRRAALQKLVAHQSTRFFRKNGAPLVTAAAWCPRAGGVRLVRAAAVGEHWVEAIVRGAAGAGLLVEAIRPADDPGTPALQLLPLGERRRRRLAAAASTRRWALLVAMLWLAVGALYLGRLRTEQHRVDARLQELLEPAAAVVAARRELGRATAMVNAIDRTEAERGALIATVGEMAAALPDSAYLTSLWLDRPGRGVMTGSARSAAEVVAALERSRRLAGVRLDGPVVREAAGGREWERFTVRFGGEDRR